MCGIIAYHGSRKASKIVLQGLKKLEYRGYDSWGIAVLDQVGQIVVDKKIGKIGKVQLNDLLVNNNNNNAKVGVGHTRWATHGGVTRKNAHPHLSNSGRFALVQNGIVENYQKLKKDLVKKGYKFKSETDTEVIVNLIEDVIASKGQTSNIKHQKYRLKVKDFREAVRTAFLQLKGRNAIVVLDKETGCLIAARQGSPLIVGKGDDEYFIASDIPAFLKYTNKVMYLDDGQLVQIKSCPASYGRLGQKPKVKSTIQFYNVKTGKNLKRRVVKVNLKPESAQKGKYLHFMIKEIMEQKDTIRRAVNQDDKEIKKIARKIKKAYGTFSVACGTAGYASMIGEYLFSKVAKRHINFVFASEFASHEPFLTDKTLMIITSQSGETADVLEAMEAAQRKRVKTIALVNVPGSTIAKQADYTFYIKAGPEQAVASTKAATSQIALHTLLAFASVDKLIAGKRLLVNCAGQVNDMLNPRYEKRLLSLAKKIKSCDDLYVIGRGVMYPVALEIALKIKEVSYIHADAMPGGELKHGTLALIEDNVPVIVVVDEDSKQAILSNAQEIKSRGGYIIGIAPENNEIFDNYIRVPEAGDAQSIVNIIPGQILAYHLAILRGCNPDKPRNLAKSVTVK